MSYIKGIYGLPGWGKTALTTYFILRAVALGIPIYANYNLKKIKFTLITTIKQAESIRWGLAVFDEFWEWVHARTSSSKINKQMMSICLKNRKRGVDMIYNSQLPRTIDVILKEVTNYRYLPQMVEHENGEEYIHYIIKDILGNYSNEYIVPFPISEIGKYFDTHEEPFKPGEEKTPLQKGIGLEQDFVNAVKKCRGVKFVDLIPNSGKGSSWDYDVLVYSKNGVYSIDVKGSSKTYIYLTEYGQKLIDKINNAKLHGATPYIAFPNNRFKRLGLVNAWYMHKLMENSYLKRLNSYPSYNKIVKNSIKLSNIDFYMK
ncbi:MAG: hypothetical protein BV457_01620 [Thermoplasmata archaeon M9B1D]|nr:MAG: hypothetical protein BV457_01620 [Thermoplasmata archaeon M9B1D]